MNHMKQRDWLLLLALLLAAWLGARGLQADILFVDEYWSIRNSGGEPFERLDWPGIWQYTAEVDPGGMGVLYHWLLNGWGRVAGWSVFAMRLFSWLAGLLALAMTYRLGAALFTRRVGLYAALMLGFSAFFIDYLHEARAYTLLALLTTAAMYSYLRLRDSEHPALVWYGALALALAALAYTHYIALALGAVLGVVHLLSFQNTRRWWGIVAAMSAGGLLFLPWLGVTLEVVNRGMGDTGRQSDSMTSLQILAELLPAFSNWNTALLLVLGIYALRERRRSALLPWVWLLVALLLVLLVNSVIPFMVHLRYLMIVWPALALLAALGVRHLRKAGLSVTILLLVWGGVGIAQSLNPAFIQQQFGQIFRAPAAGFHRMLDVLDERAEPGDMALLHIIPPGDEPFNYFVLDYYLQATPFRYDQFERMNNSFAGGDNEYLQDVNAALDGVPAVWALVMPQLEQTQRSGVVRYVLTTFYDECGLIFADAQMELRLYALPPPDEPLAAFAYGEEAITLHDLGRSVQSDSALHVVLGWGLPESVPPQTYSVALHLLDAQGALVAQTDYPLEHRRFDCTSAQVPLEQVPPGTYRLQALVYNWQTGERLPVGERDSAYLREVVVR